MPTDVGLAVGRWAIGTTTWNIVVCVCVCVCAGTPFFWLFGQFMLRHSTLLSILTAAEAV